MHGQESKYMMLKSLRESKYMGMSNIVCGGYVTMYAAARTTK